MEQQKKNPELRFEGFTENWLPGKLGDIGDVKMCKRIFNNQTADKGDIPFYKIGTFGKKADAFISEDLYNEFREKYSFPKKGDILISAAGTLGRTVVYDGKPAYFQDSNIVWINNDESKVLNEFLHYIYERITYESEGGTIQRLYNSIILNAKFAYPSSKESQRLILNFFKNIDELITKHQQKHKNLVNLKKSMLEKMFPKEGQNVPEIRFKGFEGDWEECEFQEIATIKRGLTYSPSNLRKTGTRVLRSSNIFENRFIKRVDDVFVDDTAINIEYVKEGDILITAANGSSKLVGKHALIIGTKGKVVHGGFMLLASSNVPLFLNASMSSSWYKKFVILYTAGGGGSIGNLNKSDLDQQKIYVPADGNEQLKIGKYFQNIDTLITNHLEQLQKLKNFKQSLSEKMFV